MADLPASKVMDTFKCARLDGCSLEFHEEPQQVITLRDLTGRDYVGVEIRCALCGEKRVTTVEALIFRLKKAGRGDETTSIKAVAPLLKAGCRKCKGLRWEVSYLWYNPNQPTVPFWKQDLQKRIDEAQRRRDLDRGLVT